MTTITNKKQFILYLLLIVAIIVIFNIAFRSLFFRVDLTKNNIYSLSNSSKQVINKLDDRLVAKVFFSSDLPGQYANSRRFLQDLLEEYQAYSKGHFHFEFINPDKDQEAQREARSYRIPPVQLQVVEDDKLEVKKVFMGMALIYNDQTETLPVIRTTQGLEYDITSAIKKLTATDLKGVGLIRADNKDVTTSELEKLLRKTYNLRSVSLDNEIPGEVGTIVMNGVLDSISLDRLYHLDQFLMRGGNLFISQGRVNAELRQGIGHEIESNIFDFLDHFGFKVGRDMLIDKNCGQIQIQQQQGFFTFSSAVNYPPFINIQKMNTENLIVKDLEQVKVFFVNEVTATDSGRTFIPLLRTSDKTGSISPGRVPRAGMGGYSMAEGYNLSPHIQDSQYQNPAMNSYPLDSKTVAAMVGGRFQSYFADHPEYSQRERFIGQSVDTQLLLVTDNEFFNDQRAAGIKENTDFMLNGIDYLAGDRELLEIRSRDITARPLDEVSDATRKTLKWVNTLLPALLVILLGLYRWKRNRDKRKLLEEAYGS